MPGGGLHEPLPALLDELRRCRICRDAPRSGGPLPHVPRPVIQASAEARICIAGQAPGTRAHASGRPYTDPSGVRLRAWLQLDEATFYDPRKIAIVPMGFCFPGHDALGGDLPPRRECADVWRARVMARLPNIELMLLIGQYAQRWHLARTATVGGVTGTVGRWREIYGASSRPRLLALPHPSWRNSGWLKRNPWFEMDLLPVLRADVAQLVA
ncbi:uracil-DNA glycosylase [Chelatococcus reniformis]|uniref:Uracil-DNA glycosylase n=1 Tax=Chelatococcus reniformis TaxID=1494448 RepID=A0A916UJI5_9HYPH|nr:uracil-DNA glycosylase [Chelatococcus reniformis]